jgi:hypothetical protein
MRRSLPVTPVVLAFLGLAVPGQAQTTAVDRPITEPLFSRHIIPLFSRLGCNAGSCHGAVQGKNGFRLSLFGSDPAVDHSRLLREFGGRRLNLANPASSLLLQKACGQVAHEGGKILDPSSPAYEMLLRWLTCGAPLDLVDRSRVARLEVEPAQHTGKVAASYSLRVRAQFADGSAEDVTALCTFDSRNREVAVVDRTGQVKLHGTGSAALVVRYRGQPVLAQVMVPAESRGTFPEVKGHNSIDKHVLDKLRQLQIQPAELCDDATFLRRASLDVTGALPTPGEVRTFVADPAADKRAKKIEELLLRPDHATLWATRFCDLLKPQFTERGDTQYPIGPPHARRFHDWIRVRLQENLPYDQLVERILTATSADGRSAEELVQELKRLAEEDEARDPELKAYRDRRTLDIFWLRTGATGVQGTIQIAHAFLGLRLQCAQCHRHPADVWQQDDLLSFANFFTRVGKGNDGVTEAQRNKQREELKQMLGKAGRLREQAKDKKLSKEEAEQLLQQAAELTRQLNVEGRLNNYRANYTVVGQTPKAPLARVTSSLGTYEANAFRLLGEGTPTHVAADDDPRPRVMAWLRRPDNPFFAKAIVNRVWAHYFGRGIINPPDDLSPLNPPTHPELLAELCDGFIKSGYDLRWLHRTILASRTYQQSSTPNASNEHDTMHYARFHVRRLSAEALVDAINHATGSQESYPPNLYIPAGAKAMAVPGLTFFGVDYRQRASMDYAFTIFGRSRRAADSQCDCDSSAAPSLEQGLYLAAYEDVLHKIRAPQGRAAQLAAMPDPEQAIEAAYLWTLSRLPTDAERQAIRQHLNKQPARVKGFEDLLWTLLNTREFQLIR